MLVFCFPSGLNVTQAHLLDARGHHASATIEILRRNSTPLPATFLASCVAMKENHDRENRHKLPLGMTIQVGVSGITSIWKAHIAIALYL